MIIDMIYVRIRQEKVGLLMKSHELTYFALKSIALNSIVVSGKKFK
jgi:hypothetical protein